MDSETRRTLEWAAWLLSNGYAVKDAGHAYEDALGERVGPARAVAGCGLMCVYVAAWEDRRRAIPAWDAVEYANRTQHGTFPWITVMREEGPAAIVAAIEKALAAGDES